MAAHRSRNSVLDDVQHFLATNVAVMPQLYVSFLLELVEKELTKKVCLLPSTRLEAYHTQLALKVSSRIQRSTRAA